MKNNYIYENDQVIQVKTVKTVKCHLVWVHF